MRLILTLILALPLAASAQTIIFGGHALPRCAGSRTTNCAAWADSAGNVAIDTTLPDGTRTNGATLKPAGGSSLYLWPGATEPSALDADANTFGPAGAKMSGDTMSYADLIAAWDTFTVASAFPHYSVTKTTIGADQSGTKTMYYYTFTNNEGGNLRYDRTIWIVTGAQATEWAPGLALWRVFWHAQQGHIQLPALARYIVIPSINPWGWDQSPRTPTNSRGVLLTRNFTWRWGESADAQKGTAALSEAEALRVYTLMAATVTAPAVVIDLHNQDADTCDVQGYVADTSQNMDPIERVVRYRAASTPNFACIWGGTALDPTLVNDAANLGANVFTLEGHGGTVTEPYAGSAYMTRAVQTVANVVLSYSQPDAAISRARRTAEVKATMAIGTGMAIRGTAATWAMDDAAESTVTDIYSTGSDGTLAGDAPPTWSKAGLVFTGTGYVTTEKKSIGTSSLFATAGKAFTVAVVSKCAAAGTGAMLARGTAIWMGYIANAQPQIYLRSTQNLGTAVNDGGWHMHSVRWNGTAGYYRLDSGRDQPLSVGTATEDTTYNISIGAQNGGATSRLASGCEVAWAQVRDVSLTDAELIGLYQYLRLTLAPRRVLLP